MYNAVATAVDEDRIKEQKRRMRKQLTGAWCSAHATIYSSPGCHNPPSLSFFVFLTRPTHLSPAGRTGEQCAQNQPGFRELGERRYDDTAADSDDSDEEERDAAGRSSADDDGLGSGEWMSRFQVRLLL